METYMPIDEISWQVVLHPLSAVVTKTHCRRSVGIYAAADTPGCRQQTWILSAHTAYI